MGYSAATCRSNTSYRHHRRYRITEGSEEMQMRRVGQYLFGYGGTTNDMFETPSFASRFNKVQRGGPASWLDEA